MYWSDKKQFETAIAKGATMKEALQYLYYVRNLTNADVTHSWRKNALAKGQAFQCMDGTIFVRVTNQMEHHCVCVVD